MFGAPVPAALEAFVTFLHGSGSGASTLAPRTPDQAPVWVPPELRVFAETPTGEVVGVVVAHPERPAPDWPLATYARGRGARILGQTARQALPGLVDDFLPPEPDELALSLLRVRLAVAAEPTMPWPALEGLSRVHMADGIDLVVPRGSVDPADFRRPDGDLVDHLRRLVTLGRPGSALALCRSAAFDAFRSGDDALGERLVAEMAPLHEALGRRYR